MTGFPFGSVASQALDAGILPTDIANLSWWIDADDAGSLTDAGSGEISAADDGSTAGNDLAQGTAANRPNTSTVNGNASLFFDGTDEHLDNTAGALTSEGTIAVVMTPTSTAAGVGSAVHCRDVNFGDQLRVQRDGADLTVRHDGGAQAVSLDIAAVFVSGETRWIIARFRPSGDGLSDLLTDEGTTDTVSATGVFNAPTRLAIGASDNALTEWTGHVHEVIYYDRFITDIERTNLDAYLDGKWALS